MSLSEVIVLSLWNTSPWAYHIVLYVIHCTIGPDVIIIIIITLFVRNTQVQRTKL